MGSPSGEEREACFLFQSLSVAIQRFNSVLLHNGFTDDIPESGPLAISAVFIFLFLTLGHYYTLEGIKIIIINSKITDITIRYHVT